MNYYVETICGGSNAAGGGCGAPLSFRKVTEETFEDTKGPTQDRPFDHNPWECNFEKGLVRLTFRNCSDCREL